MSTFFHSSRRTVLKGAAAASFVMAAPITLRAQPVIVRKSLANSESDRDVKTYREAVKFMLTKAEPDDPEMFHLNWYRNAMIHLLDCPHGNWWFTVWHRPYLAYFEQKIRDITGDAEFALPFWDWTQQPKIPPAFLSDPGSSDPDIRDNPLDPGSSYYVNATYDKVLDDTANAALRAYLDASSALENAKKDGNAAAIAKAQAERDAAEQAHTKANEALLDHTFPPFDKKYRDVFESLWNTFTQVQLAQLTTRFTPPDGKITFDWFWTGSGNSNSVRANFQWDVHTARFLKHANPDLTSGAFEAVKASKIEFSVRSPHFALRAAEVGGDEPRYGFNTIEGATHHAPSRTQAILEGQPHNTVHNATGAVMQSNLSSVDPIFFMHHSNVDRVWDVWTRRQMGLDPQGPHLPEHNADMFNAEEFLFYIHPDGTPVTRETTAKTFMDKARFGYSYAPGTGEEQVQNRLLFANIATERASPAASVALNSVAAASIQLNEDFVPPVTEPATSKNVLAEITTTLPASLAGLTLEVFVSPKGKVPDTSEGSPELAGAIGFFGMGGIDAGTHMHDADEPAVFDVDITDAINRLTEMAMIEAGAEIDVTLHPVRIIGGVRGETSQEAVLQSVRLKTI